MFAKSSGSERVQTRYGQRDRGQIAFRGPTARQRMSAALSIVGAEVAHRWMTQHAERNRSDRSARSAVAKADAIPQHQAARCATDIVVTRDRSSAAAPATPAVPRTVIGTCRNDRGAPIAHRDDLGSLCHPA